MERGKMELDLVKGRGSNRWDPDEIYLYFGDSEALSLNWFP